MNITLQPDLSWQEGDITLVLPLLLVTLCFILYWFTFRSEKVKAYFYRRFPGGWDSAMHITFCRGVGFLALGVIPAILGVTLMPGYTLRDFGLTFRTATALYSLFWILGLGTVMAVVGYMNASRPENLDQYPQIRAKIWTPQMAIVNAAGWVFYLLAYEFLFRGILLFPLAAHLGVWPAIAVNLALYATTHIPKGLRETLGALPLGLVLCLLTLTSGTIWIAFFVHLAMALTNSFAALKFHPDMVYVKSEQ